MWGKKFLIGFAFVLGAGVLAAQSRKIARDLQGSVPAQVKVIVQYNQPVSAAMHAKVINRGGMLNHELRSIRAGVYSMPSSQLQSLASDPAVRYISPDRPVHGFATTGGTAAMLDYHNETINAAAAWAQGLDGTGVGVAVIDSGIAAVDDMVASHVVYAQNFADDGGSSAADLYGHGTHVAGILAGSGRDSTGPQDFYTFKGIAPGVNLINLRVLDASGNSTDSAVIAAIQTAIQLQSTYNIRIINMSLGGGVYESYTLDPVCQAVEQAYQAGIVVVISAGNEGRNNSAGTNGYGTTTSPGNDPYAITVGAMNTMGTPDPTDDVPTSYSSKGPTQVDEVIKPDLVAPGNLIVSLYTPNDTLDQETPGNEVPYSLFQTNGSNQSSREYFILSGTSMAAPMVSATAALILQQNPSFTPDQVKALLMETSDKNLLQSSVVTDPTTGQTFNEQADIFTVGAGYLDMQAALAGAATPPPAGGSAMSPLAAIDDQGNIDMANGTPANGEPVLWGSILPDNTVWGTTVLSAGTTPQSGPILWGTSSLVGNSVIWGGSTDAGESVIWGGSTDAGESVIWGGSTTAGQSVIWGGSIDSAEAVLHGDK